jgi:CRISPR system Cascade subunit CasB
LQPAVWRLAEGLGLEESDSQALLLLASALAHVKEDAEDSRSLAYGLGLGPVAKDEKPRLSALRFQRLMRADEPDDFLQQLRRALSIGGERTDVATLAEDLFAWSAERTHAHRRSSGMKFRWARDYYLKRPDQGLIPDLGQAV